MANRRFIDFPIAASVGDNDIVLIWQDGLNKQTTKATLLQGSPQSLAGLTDVDIAGLTNGQILQYNSTLGKWENVDRTDINLSELGDVTIVAPTNGQVLVYNSSTSKWENSSGGYVPYTGAVTTVNLGAQTIQAGSFVKAGGTSAQFLKADGSVDSTAYGTGSVTSVGLTMPSAFSVANTPVTTAGTLAVTGAGTVAQYIRGDGSLADFPATTGGGASVSYYLNGSVSQGTIGGVAYREFNRTPIFGAGTDITTSSNGYIANFITDAGDPNKLEIPAGNWNLETYFSASSGGGSPTFYVELYKYDGTTFTLIATSSGTPELIAFGTNINPYFSTLAVPQTTLTLTDRLALRYYVNTSGRTITLHTENNHLCQVITTFTTGLTALNGLTSQVQFFAVGTSGTDFAISSATDTHTFNLPTASGTNRGALNSTDWTTFNNKENAITAGTTAQYFRGDKTFQTLNTSVVPEGTNLYYTEARVNANTNVAANTAARHNAVTLGTANGLSLSTQVLSLGLASAGVTGALSGTDWSTFNNKQNALTNPVTGTGTTNYLAKFTGSTMVGNSQVFDNGTNVGIATTPSAWAATALQINNVGLAARPAASSLMQLSVNQYWDGSNHRYISSNFASLYTQNVGGHNWSLTSSGTAGNVITWNTVMTLTNSGNLLVGTETDSGFKLDVNGTGRFSGVLTTNSGTNSTNGIQIISSLSSSLFTGGIEFIRTTVAGGSKVQPLRDAAIGGVGLNFLVTANNTAEVNATYTSAMAILNNGNVGIGTTSPEIYGAGWGRAVGVSASSGYSVIQMAGSSGNGGEIDFGNNTIRHAGIASLDGSILGFFTNGSNSGTSLTERMRITSGGNVLIGTTTDTGGKLQVNGDLFFTSTAKAIVFNSSANFNTQIYELSGSIVIRTGGNDRLTIASTGAATFSSSVTAEGTFFGKLNAVYQNSSTNILNVGADQSMYGGTNSDGGVFVYGNNKLHLSTNSARRLTIDGSGNVGIGTTAPTPHFGGNALIIQGLSGSRGIMEIWDNSGTGGKAVFQQVGGDTYLGNLAKGSGSGDLFLTANGSISTSFKANGNVLIGTTTDVGARLHVNGAVRTGAPSGGSAVDWRLGTARGGTITPNAIVRVEIGGVLVDLDARYV
jgi:hypothetical protein